MSRFSMTFTARPEDIDVLGHVNNAVWITWMQTISVAHWDAWAPEADREAYFWVVTRHEVDYRGNVVEGESVTAETWVPEPPRGARFDRHVRFIGADGKVKVQAVSTWAMLDKASARLVRVPARLAELFLER